MNISTEIETDNGIFAEVPTVRKISTKRPNEPIGLKVFGAFYRHESADKRRKFHQILALLLTYLAYTCYHMGRRPLSIVKNVLNRNCSEARQELLNSLLDEDDYKLITLPPKNVSDWCDWAPFNDDDTANELLAILDTAFLLSYALFMFVSGFLADRCNLRYYLSFGMVASGFLLYAFGLSYYLNIHSMNYCLVIQLLAGALQATGWPAVVTCVGNWFGPSSRGLVFGIWSSHTNIGNILGSTIAGYYVQKAWGLSFLVPGFIMMLSGFVIFLFLVPRPQDIGLPADKLSSVKHSQLRDRSSSLSAIITETSFPTRRKPFKKSINDGDSSLIDADDIFPSSGSEQSLLICPSGEDVFFAGNQESAASFRSCLKVPGVLEYSLCLFFSKLVSYTFLYWLPRYITQSTLNNSEDSAYLSTPFDIGGIFGAIIAGYLSDRFKTSGILCSIMLMSAIPAMYVYEEFAAISNFYNIVLQLIVGAFVNGPCALITTAISTDLGGEITNGKAMATVTAIIDGTGSLGAAIGPLFAGILSDTGWESVFLMLMISDLLASVCLMRITLKEVKRKFSRLPMID